LAAKLDESQFISLVRVRFTSPVLVGDCAELLLLDIKDTGCSLQIEVEGTIACRTEIKLGSLAACPPPFEIGDTDPVLPAAPVLLELEEIPSQKGQVRFACLEQDISKTFPTICAKWTPSRVQSVLATTTLVGMVCPGLNSLFAGLSLSACEDGNETGALSYAVQSVDERFRLTKMKVAGPGLFGIVDAFVRLPPTAQLGAKELAGHFAPQEFAGTVVLVVGGSRGLGELTAKLLASAGAEVIVTYARGKDDAERVASEIISAGWKCRVIPYDVTSPAEPQLADLVGRVTHLYYFATPAIFRKQAEIFSLSRYEEFSAYYVTGFYNLIHALSAKGSQKLAAYYPSSIAVENRPREMTEYAMAKMAGEVLCADLNSFSPNVRVVVSRLPRVKTDQTATPMPVESADPVEVMLDAIRKTQLLATTS